MTQQAILIDAILNQTAYVHDYTKHLELKPILTPEAAMYLINEMKHEFLKGSDLELQPLLEGNINQLVSMVEMIYGSKQVRSQEVIDLDEN